MCWRHLPNRYEYMWFYIRKPWAKNETWKINADPVRVHTNNCMHRHTYLGWIIAKVTKVGKKPFGFVDMECMCNTQRWHKIYSLPWQKKIGCSYLFDMTQFCNETRLSRRKWKHGSWLTHTHGTTERWRGDRKDLFELLDMADINIFIISKHTHSNDDKSEIGKLMKSQSIMNEKRFGFR